MALWCRAANDSGAAAVNSNPPNQPAPTIASRGCRRQLARASTRPTRARHPSSGVSNVQNQGIQPLCGRNHMWASAMGSGGISSGIQADTCGLQGSGAASQSSMAVPTRPRPHAPPRYNRTNTVSRDTINCRNKPPAAIASSHVPVHRSPSSQASPVPMPRCQYPDRRPVRKARTPNHRTQAVSNGASTEVAATGDSQIRLGPRMAMTAPPKPAFSQPRTMPVRQTTTGRMQAPMKPTRMARSGPARRNSSPDRDPAAATDSKSGATGAANRTRATAAATAKPKPTHTGPGSVLESHRPLCQWEPSRTRSNRRNPSKPSRASHAAASELPESSLANHTGKAAPAANAPVTSAVRNGCHRNGAGGAAPCPPSGCPARTVRLCHAQ